ncbi:MAG: PaaI family thioesterase [Acidimicrobiales bacterium]
MSTEPTSQPPSAAGAVPRPAPAPSGTSQLPLDEMRARIAAAFTTEVDPADLPPRRQLAWRIGDAARNIVERLVDTRATDEALETVGALLEQTAERLEGFEHGRRYESWAEASTAGGVGSADGGPPEGHLDYSPIVGRANPLAPPIDIRLEIEGEHPVVVGTVTFGSAYEGPPGSVHGGLVAAAFDEVMGAAQALSGQPGMTGTLTVVYRSPTPLRVPLRFEARLDKVEGRKLFVAGRVTAGETLCAEATGVFISVDFERLVELQRRRDGG